MKEALACGIAAGFLRSGRTLSNASNCAALIAAAGALMAHVLAARLAFAASILCWPVACYFGLRVSIDASLFRELSRDPVEGGEALDELLHAWGYSKRKPGRTIAERSLGAIRLWKRLMLAVSVQLVSLAAGILLLAVL